MATRKTTSKKTSTASKLMRWLNGLDKPAGPARTRAARERQAFVRNAKRNPARRRNPATYSARNKSDTAALRAAERMSQEFHGTPSEVVELSPRERSGRSRYGVVVGRLEELAYRPDRRSKRGGSVWVHESGDRGPFARRSRTKPIIVADPKSKEIAIVPNGSGQKFSSRRGIVG